MALWLFSLLEAVRACRDFFLRIAEFLSRLLFKTDLVLKYQELFGYTAKTWITDQDARLDERYISFDVPEFRLGVGKLLDVPYLAIAKVRDEDYSKIYSLKTMRKRELLFTMPTPLAGDIHTLVVSQVATMEFVSVVLFASFFRPGGAGMLSGWLMIPVGPRCLEASSP
jgi:hypothetical protein